MAELVGKRYASSLFEVGIELNKLDDFHSQLEFIEKTFRSEEKLIQILEHPRISKGEKRRMLENIFTQNISKEILNFLFIIIDKRREDSLMDIVREYNTLFKEYKGILEIEAVTAVSMKEDAKEKLKLVLKNRFKKEIQLSNSIDPSIIGGVVLKMDNKVIDSSLKSQLKEMESIIKGVSL
ncbi:F0F1 ATP synthase subunit delta [Tissierella creatinophila]|uniref:ATP synthase subunit delta n=1 Tax=Tissierella creatinophila DSM 6911 TaxID=1123403 RepID=A0A1U7M3G5_TISCR|nr:F0F1 ATP synthase subunit delta [Tissierella creatinophila]OLS01826.1 ATP synthase subunit delta, sodium ion specific [Tissierella creatinophila DSM 6911]